VFCFSVWLCFCVCVYGRNDKQDRSFGVRISGRTSLFSSLDLRSSSGLFGTCASYWSLPSLSGPTAFSHSHVGLRWSARSLHVPRFSFFVFVSVGHESLFLVSASGGEGS